MPAPPPHQTPGGTSPTQDATHFWRALWAGTFLALLLSLVVLLTRAWQHDRSREATEAILLDLKRQNTELRATLARETLNQP